MNSTRLDRSTWLEVNDYLKKSDGIFLPIGSIEQHGPIGLIGTDALCAESIAEAAAKQVDALVAPTVAYAPAPFNLHFPGSVSIRPKTFKRLVRQIISSLHTQGFRSFYLLNGHGANNAPLLEVAEGIEGARFYIREWWSFPEVSEIRDRLFGDWEGMHATPSEISITQSFDRIVESELASSPPEKLSREFIRAHTGDRHGPPDEHRRQFPDGRVGSHSALARPEHGTLLLDAASKAVANDYRDFLNRVV